MLPELVTEPTEPTAAWFDSVTFLMQELFGSGKEERIIAEMSIVVKVERPDVPCLDLVDLPGLTQFPEEKAEGSLALEVECLILHLLCRSMQ